ncbi:unnamed protein product [Caenorhabditis nigoni]
MSLPPAPSQFNQSSISVPENNLSCPICGFVFKNQLSLKAHNKKKQGKCKPPTKKRFFCDLCPSGFGENSNLRVHMNKYHGSPEIHLKTVIKGMKTANPEFDECQLLKDVFVAYSSILQIIGNKENHQIFGSLSPSSSVSPPSDSPVNALPTIPNRKRTPFMINDILN